MAIPRYATPIKKVAGPCGRAPGRDRRFASMMPGTAYVTVSNGGVVSMSHLLHGARREMQNAGRLVNEKDMTVRR